MKILVCGGRDYANAPALNEALDAIHREKHVTRLIHGAARGADALAAAWAASRGISNEDALKRGGRLLSAYGQGDRRFWIITEHDRSATTILLPEDY